MSRFISIMILVVILTFSASKESWQCDTENTYRCATTQTCCRNLLYKSQWACFNSVNAVCCSDGLHACPAGYICNMPEKRCDPAPK